MRPCCKVGVLGGRGRGHVRGGGPLPDTSAEEPTAARLVDSRSFMLENRGMKRARLHITGASGSGTTTLGRALAEHWSTPHADADDYLFMPSSPPYTEKRPESDRVALMQALFVPREAWVLSGSVVGWGESVIAECDAVVLLELDPSERLRRLEAREARRRAGRDFDETAWTEFLDWARGYDDPDFPGRSRVSHDAWLSDLPQPVLRLNSASPVAVLCDAVSAWEPGVLGSSSGTRQGIPCRSGESAAGCAASRELRS